MKTIPFDQEKWELYDDIKIVESVGGLVNQNCMFSNQSQFGLQQILSADYGTLYGIPKLQNSIIWALQADYGACDVFCTHTVSLL